jgi:hypothetical protein
MEDEPIIFATLMDLDVRQLLDTPAEQRHKQLFLMQDEFPQDIIFHAGPRIDEDGLRWAPSSFRNTSTMLFEAEMGRPCPSGLLVSCSGAVFVDLEMPLDRHFMILDVGRRTWIQCTAVFSKDEYSVRDAEWERVRPRDQSRCGLIFKTPRTVGPDLFAIFVIITREEGGALYVRYGCRAILTQIDQSQAMALHRDTLGGILPVPVGVVTPPDSGPPRPMMYARASVSMNRRQWCVG